MAKRREPLSLGAIRALSTRSTAISSPAKLFVATLSNQSKVHVILKCDTAFLVI
jgi:hypothetical protein